MITAVYRSGEVIEFPVVDSLIGGSFENEEGSRPVRFVIPAGLGRRVREYLQGYVHHSYGDSADMVKEK